MTVSYEDDEKIVVNSGGESFFFSTDYLNF